MSIPLTLGVPGPREDRSLTGGLLLPRCRSVAEACELPVLDVLGPPILTASQLRQPGAPAAIAWLDIVPESISSDNDVIRFHLDCTAEEAAQALGLKVSPLAIFVEGPVDVEMVRTIAAAGRSPAIEASAAAGAVADFLSVLAHTDVGFVARASTGPEVVSILAATVAALRGDDVRSAFTKPDVAALQALKADAAGAVRDVLLGIEISAVAPVIDHLADLGLLPAGVPQRTATRIPK